MLEFAYPNRQCFVELLLDLDDLCSSICSFFSNFKFEFSCKFEGDDIDGLFERRDAQCL